MRLARNFQVLVEPVQKSDVVVTDTPFIPPTQQSTGVTGQKQSFGAASQGEVKKATQPVEAPSAVFPTRLVEAPVASSEMPSTDQDSSLSVDGDRPEVQPPGPTAQPAGSVVPV